jgi:muramoyltetrapeptide carboxypeptidase
MLRPPKLKEGDRVGIVSTARKISREELRSGMDWLRTIGLESVLGKSIGLEAAQFAGNDDERAKDLQRMIDDPMIRAIWFARGGYGSARILSKVNWSALESEPKWLIGYSDITAIHAKIQGTGLQSLHATMPINVQSNHSACLIRLQHILMGDAEPLKWDRHPLNKIGTATGILVGGNLSVLYSLRGTPFEPPYAENILFLEDLDEYLYHIDRMMTNLKLGGVLRNISGLVVGGMTDMNDNAIPFGKNAEEIISAYMDELAIPVAFGLDAGHLDNNTPLILGASVRLKVGTSSEMEYV